MTPGPSRARRPLFLLNPCLPPEPLRHDIPLARILAARRRLGVLHGREMPLHLSNELAVGTPREDLGDISAARPKSLGRKLQARFNQRHRPQMIGLLMAD